MFSGKTEELIRRLRRAQIAQMPTIIFKPRIDSRYSETHIVSHNKMKLESHLVNTPQEILHLAENASVVAIDEAQFFNDSILEVCKTLASQGKRVVVAGLDTDYRGIPFGPMPQLMCEADYLDKLRAICVQCGHLANVSYRTSDEEGTVVLGEKNNYEPRCRVCASK